jgi:hypothetical protein
MALSNPEQPELKRFSFFVSRRFEEGRERFRLHMGYFDTLHEAEEWLGAVRDIYPGAWAGEAPGKKLRERAVAAAAAQAQHAAGPPPVHLNVPTVHAATPAAQAAAPAQVPRNVPVAKPAAELVRSEATATHRLPDAPTAKPRAVIITAQPPKNALATPKVAPISETTVAKTTLAKATPVVAVAVAPRASSPAQSRSDTPVAGSPSGRPAVTARPATAPPSAKAGTSPATKVAPTAKVAAPAKDVARGSAARQVPQAAAVVAVATARPQSASPARPQGVPSGRPQAVATGRPNSKSAKSALPNSNVREVLKALEEAPADAEITGETRMMPAPPMPADIEFTATEGSFTDTQVLKFLETRRADGREIAGVDIETGAISLLKPDDTGTRRALKEAVVDNAAVSFAVQLQWSVQPVELSKVPPLAIFSAYTLYTVEGSRDSRKWYGLRLGFFSDAISAKQVAYYVRSEFTSVAVVPVSPQERTRASDGDKKAELAFPKKSRSESVDEFKLIDSDTPPMPRQAPTKAAGPARAVPAVAGRRGKAAGRVRANERRGPQTLEETLEILGAGELEMDNGNGETMNESGVRHLRVEVQKNTPFGRLLERLSERVRKP